MSGWPRPVYRVLPTVVRQRTAEIGVRMTLGAAPPRVFQLIVASGLRLSALGIALGIFAPIQLTRSCYSRECRNGTCWARLRLACGRRPFQCAAGACAAAPARTKTLCQW
jgi:hypothetical protein